MNVKLEQHLSVIPCPRSENGRRTSTHESKEGPRNVGQLAQKNVTDRLRNTGGRLLHALQGHDNTVSFPSSKEIWKYTQNAHRREQAGPMPRGECPKQTGGNTSAYERAVPVRQRLILPEVTTRGRTQGLPANRVPSAARRRVAWPEYYLGRRTVLLCGCTPFALALWNSGAMPTSSSRRSLPL